MSDSDAIGDKNDEEINSNSYLIGIAMMWIWWSYVW